MIDNRPSAGSIVGSAAVAQAAPDGYTLLLMSNANAVSASLFRKLPFDVEKRLRAGRGCSACSTWRCSLPPIRRFRSVAELVAEAKAQPGKLTIGTIAVGSTQQLSAELFKTRTGIDALIVPYKGSPAVLTALRAGEIDLAFEILGPMLPQLQAEVVRALAVTSDRRFAALPEVPTLQQAGVADYDVASWNALAAPAKTPPAIVQRLNAAANEALKSPGGARAARWAWACGRTAARRQQLQTLLDGEIRHWRAVIGAAQHRAAVRRDAARWT